MWIVADLALGVLGSAIVELADRRDSKRARKQQKVLDEPKAKIERLRSPGPPFARRKRPRQASCTHVIEGERLLHECSFSCVCGVFYRFDSCDRVFSLS